METGQPLKPKITVDVVVFSDGSTWGPQEQRESAHLLG